MSAGQRVTGQQDVGSKGDSPKRGHCETHLGTWDLCYVYRELRFIQGAPHCKHATEAGPHPERPLANLNVGC